MSKQASDMLRPCINSKCKLLRQEHDRSSGEGDKLPDIKNFPTFRDEKDDLMKDPYEFLTKLERLMEFYSIRGKKRGQLLLQCVPDRVLQDSVQANIIKPSRSWVEMKRRFIEKFDDPTLKNKLFVELEMCAQGMKERVHAYTQRFHNLVCRIACGKPTDTLSNIVACERGFIPAIRAELAKYRVTQTDKHKHKKPYEFSTLKSIYDAAASIETGLLPMEGKVHGRGLALKRDAGADRRPSARTARSRWKRARTNHVTFTLPAAAVAMAPAHGAAARAAPVTHKIEMVAGTPTNVNKKGGRGGFRGGRGGRGGYQGRGGTGSGAGGGGYTGSNARPLGQPVRGGFTSPHRAQQDRVDADPRRAQLYAEGKCFNCGQTGHRAYECPNAPSSNHVRVLTTAFASMRRYMTITSPKLHGQHKLLNDTGAQFSSISLKLARQHNLVIVAPTSHEPRYLAMADRTKFVKRIGSVVLPITIHFNGGIPREPYSCVKRLEVMNMDFDFIIGVDLLPSLFPADDVMNYLILPSRITSPPQLASSKEVQGAAERFGGVCTLVYAHGDQVPTQVEADDDILREYVNERVYAHFQALSACVFEDVPTLEPYVCSTAPVDDDSLTLTDQVVDEMGVGRTPPLELPQKPTSSTPTDKEAEYKPMRERVMSSLAQLLKENNALTGFCTGEGSVVTLSVARENEQKVYAAPYPIPQALHATVDECIQRWLQQGRITLAPKNCPFNSPLLAVKKKDEHGRMTGVRVCLDVRKLNMYLVENDRFQIPRINEMLATLAGGCIFGEFDLSEAYFQFRLTPESQRYTAFQWNKQQYMWVGCPFGIKHIPSLFQRFIAQLFRDMPFVFAYLDNICFSSKDEQQHREHAKMIIERLSSVNLRIKPTSVNLGNYLIKLLGHLLTPYGIGVDPEKQQMIMTWPQPTTGAMLASFLGLGTFLRDHIRHYADLTAAFERIKKGTTIEWTPQLQRQWQLVKRAFSTAPFLRFPDFTQRFVIATDASQTGIGGVLYQPSDDSNTITGDNIVAIVSKQLNDTQRRYPVYKKELWAVVYCLRKFHTFIHGRRKVTVLTDHKPLIHILKQQQLSNALQQWLDVLLDYDLTIMYRPGILHVVPDALSRMYMSTYMNNTDVWGVHDNLRIIDDFNAHSSPSDFLCAQSINEARQPTAIKPRHRLPATASGEGAHTFTHSHHSINAMSAPDIDDDHRHEFVAAQTAAPIYCMPVGTRSHDVDSDEEEEHQRNEADHREVASNENAETEVPQSVKLNDEEKLLLAQEKRGKKVPTVEEQQQLISEAHAAGHYGEKAMYKYIELRGYWWPHMRTAIEKEIDQCRSCQKYNLVRAGFHPARSVFAARPGDHFQMDLAQLPRSVDGMVYILLMIDVFTGFVVLTALPNKEDATVARAVWNVFCIIGLPRILQSDNGDEFTNRIIRALCRITGIDRRFIAAYNPRADGKVERAVKTVKQMIVKLVYGAAALWPLYLPFVQLMYNNKVKELTGTTPFALMYGRKLNDVRDYTNEAGEIIDDALTRPARSGALCRSSICR